MSVTQNWFYLKLTQTLLRIDPHALLTIHPQTLLKSTQNRPTNVSQIDPQALLKISSTNVTQKNSK